MLCVSFLVSFIFFFFNDTATTEIYTLSLHDALPICDPHKPAVPWSAHPRGEVPEGHYRVPIGRAALVREGKEVSVLTYGTMVHVAEAAVRLAGVDAEIVDVRSMAPLDVDTLCTSVCKTGRCVVVHEATRFSGYG